MATTQDALAQLAEGFGGQLLSEGDAGYDEARVVFNAMIERRPALIARCSGTADVISAVRYAREQDLPIAVRCGGHSVSGHSAGDEGALVIDLSPMKGVRVDPEGQTARANGGVLWGEYDRETQAFGLATPGGRVTTTGVGGFTLGGGYGWLSTKYGLSCDNLLSADVVTADSPRPKPRTRICSGASGVGAGTSASSRRSSSVRTRSVRSTRASCSTTARGAPTPWRRTGSSSTAGLTS